MVEGTGGKVMGVIEANLMCPIFRDPGATISYGTNATNRRFTAGTPVMAIYATTSSTSAATSAEPFYVKSTLTGAGQVGGRSRFHCYTNVAAGGWVNALKSYMEFGASGKCTGLASSFCGELVLSEGTTSASYCAIEGEIVMDTGASIGEHTSFFYLNASGAGISAFDTGGTLFHIGDGITAAAGKFCSANYQTLKCYFTDSATTRYLVLSQTENGLGIGASGSAVTLTAGSPIMSLYTTCAGAVGTNAEPLLVHTTLTGAGQVGGRAKFYMTANVALGSWSNALKSEVVYGASGYTTGLGSAICAEITLSAGTTQGTYAPLESEIGMATGGSTGTATSFLYCNTGGTGTGTLDDNLYFFEIGAGITADDAGAHLFTTADAAAATHGLRVRIDGTTYWLMLSDSVTGD
jgi:hypothetical protein